MTVQRWSLSDPTVGTGVLADSYEASLTCPACGHRETALQGPYDDVFAVLRVAMAAHLWGRHRDLTLLDRCDPDRRVVGPMRSVRERLAMGECRDDEPKQPRRTLVTQPAAGHDGNLRARLDCGHVVGVSRRAAAQYAAGEVVERACTGCAQDRDRLAGASAAAHLLPSGPMSGSAAGAPVLSEVR